MQERHSDRERYFDEQARTTEKYYIPYIRKCFPELPQEVLEVGCGEGGNLFSFAKLGCSVTGVDIAAGRVAERMPRVVLYNSLDAWGIGRELPEFAKETFNEMWNKRLKAD